MSPPQVTDLRVTVVAAEKWADDVTESLPSQVPCDVTVTTSSPEADLDQVLQTGAVDAFIVDASVGTTEPLSDSRLATIVRGIQESDYSVSVVVSIPDDRVADVNDLFGVDGVSICSRARLTDTVGRQVWNLVRQQRAVADVTNLNQNLAESHDRIAELETVVSSRMSDAVRNAISAFSAVTATFDTTDTDVPPEVDDVETALNTLQEVADDVTALAEYGAPVADEDRKIVSVRDVAESVWEFTMPDDATLHVENNIDISADRDRMQRFFSELFRNVQTYVGDDATVTIGALPDGDGFYVGDDGPGWQANPPGKVLEPGYTSTDTGTGVGLAIVRRIAAAHNWDVRLTDASESATPEADAESESRGARLEVLVA